MIKNTVWYLGLLVSFVTHAFNCPDPQNTSLKWGVPPEPWTKSPFSENNPQSDEYTQFQRVTILVAGYGQGVVCTYSTSVGNFSIWREVRTKIPSPLDYSWIEIFGGFVCTQSLESCDFYTVD